MMLALVLSLACQEDVYIRRIDKVRYLEATQLCKEGEAKIDSDPAGAIERFTRILQDPALTELECSMRIQQSDIYGPPYLFLPYQYRARARLAMAGKSANPAERKQLLEGAVADLKASVERKVPSSAKLLTAADAELTKLSKPAPANPPADSTTAKLRTSWQELIAERKFKAARQLIDRDGAGLSETERASLVADTDQACRAFLVDRMARFRKSWSAAAALDDLQALTSSEFELAFALPEEQDLTVAHPTVEWARAHLEALRHARSKQPSLPALLAMAEGAARLEEDADNPWYKLAEGLAFQVARRDVEKRLADGVDAPRAVRAPLLEEAAATVAAWKRFEGRLDAEVRKRTTAAADHLKALDALLATKPRDLAELDGEDLKSCFDGFPVEPRLLAEEEKFRKRDAEGGITRESRQKLATLIVAAKSLRLFLTGSSDDAVREAVREDLARLSRVGGAVDPDRFGPRIRKVFDSLR
jgi:hypothetical protein